MKNEGFILSTISLGTLWKVSYRLSDEDVAVIDFLLRVDLHADEQHTHSG